MHNGDCSHRSSVDTEAEALALVSAFPNPDMCNFSSAVCGGAIRDMMMGRPRNIFDGFWYEQAGGLIAVIVVPIVLVCICIGICVLCICWKQAVVVVHHQGGKHLPALEHPRRRSACICQHQRIRSRCKECGWARRRRAGAPPWNHHFLLRLGHPALRHNRTSTLSSPFFAPGPRLLRQVLARAHGSLALVRVLFLP